MPKSLTFSQAAAAMRRFDSQSQRAVLKGINHGLRFALRQAVTKYMVGGGKDAPPNDPPGPLRIRRGNLRRSVRIVPAAYDGNQYTGGLQAGGTSAKHAAIHEYGGKTKLHVILPKKKGGVLRFIGKDGNVVFCKRVMHKGSLIPARPFLKPAMEEAQPVTIQAVEQEVAALAASVLGG